MLTRVEYYVHFRPPTIMQSALTPNHIKESISRAHVRAITGSAGMMVVDPDFDYKMDGTIRKVSRYNNIRGVTGFSIDFQLKASSANYKIENNLVHYPLTQDTHHYLVGRAEEKSSPCILILCCLHEKDANWLDINHDRSLLYHCCYWFHVEGAPTKKTKEVVKIPTSNILTPQALLDIMAIHEKGEFFK